MGQRAMQRLNFRLRGELLRSATWHAEQLPGNWIAAADAAYEAIVIAINDQPVSLRFAASAFLRDDARQIVAGVPTAQVWGWTGTAGVRMAFFSPPVPRRSESEAGIDAARAAPAARRVSPVCGRAVPGLLLLLAASGRAAAADDADVTSAPPIWITDAVASASASASIPASG